MNRYLLMTILTLTLGACVSTPPVDSGSQDAAATGETVKASKEAPVPKPVVRKNKVKMENASKTIDRKNTAPEARRDFLKTPGHKFLNGNFFADNVHGPDFDREGNTFRVFEVNGSAKNVGKKMELPSGALLTVQKDGRFRYDPRKGFAFLAKVGSSSADSVKYSVIDSQGLVSNEALVVFSVLKTKNQGSEVLSKR